MRTAKRFLMLFLALSFSYVATSCRPNQTKQVVKTVSKYADDYIDDVSRKGIKVKKNPIKQCKNCSGKGQVYYQGYWYKCSNCNGTGKVIIN